MYIDSREPRSLRRVDAIRPDMRGERRCRTAPSGAARVARIRPRSDHSSIARRDPSDRRIRSDRRPGNRPRATTASASASPRRRASHTSASSAMNVLRSMSCTRMFAVSRNVASGRLSIPNWPETRTGVSHVAHHLRCVDITRATPSDELVGKSLPCQLSLPTTTSRTQLIGSRATERAEVMAQLGITNIRTFVDPQTRPRLR